MRTRLTMQVPLLLTLLGCQLSGAATMTDVASFPLDSLEGIVSADGITLDEEISDDGGGALRIEVETPTVVRLFVIDEVDVEDTQLSYAASLRSENLEGHAYLEMWCVFEDVGEFFSRGLADPLSGTVEWSRRQTPFFLKAGENPDRILLNLVVDGRGTVWIDDIVLSKTTN